MKLPALPAKPDLNSGELHGWAKVGLCGMRMRHGIIALCSLIAVPIQAAVEFSGYMKSPVGTSFVLTDRETGKTSDFLTIGGSFQGHTIVSFDSEGEILSIQNAVEVIHLSLRRPLVRDANSTQNSDRLTIVVSADGTISHNGRQLDVNSLKERFQRSAVDGWLFLHVKAPAGADNRKVRTSMLSVMRSFRSSGVLGRLIWDEVK